tara:strand:+ start:35079 stop:35867 length:789 start_codon:yes stop_codon:yes gene_type:complete
MSLFGIVNTKINFSIEKFIQMNTFKVTKLVNVKKPLVLCILFFLPVIFLLFLYPSKHNYKTLDIVKYDITELNNFHTLNGQDVGLKDQLSVVTFLGKRPMQDPTIALNLKELIYDKFLGFKRFQVLALVPFSAKDQVNQLKKELDAFVPLQYWKFAFASENLIQETYNNFKTSSILSSDLNSSSVFLVDKERNQRGRLDDRTKSQIEQNSTAYGLSSYNVLDISDLKNKMSDDIRILFTEYRQKRKGTYDSFERRAKDLKNE